MPTAPQTCGNQEILFVGGARPLPAADEVLRLYLLALGQRVTVRSDQEVKRTDANWKSLVIISESVESSEVNSKFRDVAVPLLTWEGWLQDDLGMTAAGKRAAAAPDSTHDKDEGAYGENLGQKAILIVDPSHPLAAGYQDQVTTVQHDSNRFHWGVPNRNAQRVARDVDDPEHSMIYAYEAGAAMVNGIAPARRVFLHNATGTDLTNAGLSIFLNAVYWTMGCLDETPTPTPTASTTATSVPTLTISATPTPSPTLSPTATASATPSPTVTPTATATVTAQPPTTTPTPSATAQPPTTTPSTTTPSTTTPSTTATPQPSTTATPTPPPVSSATPTATPPPTDTATTTKLTVDKRDLLFTDADEDGLVSPGDTLLYQLRLSNAGTRPLQQLMIDDPLDGHTTLRTGTVQSSQGSVLQGNHADDSRVSVAVEVLAPGATVEVAFQVQIDAQVTTAVLINQAMVSFLVLDGQPQGQAGQQASDDPDTVARDDATLTPLGIPLERQLYLPWIAH